MDRDWSGKGRTGPGSAFLPGGGGPLPPACRRLCLQTCLLSLVRGLLRPGLDGG